MFYAALDVSLRSVAICIIDQDGKVRFERSVPSEVPDLVRCLREFGEPIHQVGLEAGTLTQHLTYGLTEAGFDVELHVGLKGTMNALFLKDLGAKTHRGLRGRVEAGKVGGGNAYGYQVVRTIDASGKVTTGEREIISEEAEVVRRIFRDYAAGKSPRRIAIELNREGVPAPWGAKWGDTSIRGNRALGSGIINNEFYIGEMIWNRRRRMKNPDTGRCEPRFNPESEWVHVQAPHLRIISDELWNAARSRQDSLIHVCQHGQEPSGWVSCDRAASDAAVGPAGLRCVRRRRRQARQ